MEEGAPYLTPSDAAWGGVLAVYLTISTEPMQALSSLGSESDESDGNEHGRLFTESHEMKSF